MKTLILVIAVSIINLTASAQNIEKILNQYLKVKDALIKSESEATSTEVKLLSKTVEQTKTFTEKKILLKAIRKMEKQRDLEKQRNAFEDVSTILWKVIKSSNDLKQNVYYQYCPMKKAYWISKESTIKNPYYGSKMLTCGNISDKKIN